MCPSQNHVQLVNHFFACLVGWLLACLLVYFSLSLFCILFDFVVCFVVKKKNSENSGMRRARQTHKSLLARG